MRAEGVDMAEHAVPMQRVNQTRITELLGPIGVHVEPYHPLGGGVTVKCSRSGVSIFLSSSQPAHWAVATDDRKDLVLVAALGESLLAFWKKPAENRLRDEIIAVLRQVEWKPQPGRA